MIGSLFGMWGHLLPQHVQSAISKLNSLAYAESFGLAYANRATCDVEIERFAIPKSLDLGGSTLANVLP